jgi:hypothetical protein
MYSAQNLVLEFEIIITISLTTRIHTHAHIYTHHAVGTKPQMNVVVLNIHYAVFLHVLEGHF